MPDFSDMDLTPRYAPSAVVIPDWSLKSKLGSFRDVPVVQYIFHPENSHKGPIRKDWPALELVTAKGSRWYGCVNAHINAELRMIVVGTPKRDEVRMAWEVVPEELR